MAEFGISIPSERQYNADSGVYVTLQPAGVLALPATLPSISLQNIIIKMHENMIGAN